MDNTAGAERYAAAARQAVRAFPIDPAELTPVWLAENVTFRVTATDGRAYVLRLHRPGYHALEALEAERMWTQSLAEAGVGAPVGVRTRDGGWYAPVRIPLTDEIRYAGMAGWTAGELLSDVLDRDGPSQAPVHFSRLGEVMAGLHNHAAAWSLPPGFIRHALDRDGLMGDTPFWGRFWESTALSAAERALAFKTRSRIHAALDRLGRDPAIFTLIHADLHSGNVLVGGGPGLTVIDFDDAGFGWHPYDIAVALFYHQAESHFPGLRDALLAGYRSTRSLNAHTESLIPMFLLVRGLAVIGWLHQRPEINPARFMARMKARIMADCETFVAPL